ncbi:MAG: hypothetical protein HYS20_03515 [Rhodocyclales bacterium]|nr:hypothetical protein [Rhodocyclales bacterium]
MQTFSLRAARHSLLALAVAAISGCGTIADCGDVLGNKDEPRIRSSAMRMLLADPAAASARFAPYAAMAALAYEEAPQCDDPRVVEQKPELLKFLQDGGWRQDDGIAGLPACDDDIGMFYRVWVRDRDGHKDVVLVFRGTKDGIDDWVDGNLRWVTRFLPGEDQYVRSRKVASALLEHLRAPTASGAATKPVRLYSAGHSLGGGLAQNVLYAYPRDFVQAFAFDPSPVTGFADNDVPERQAGCDCKWDSLDGEARVYRVYETDEVLAWLRFPLKLVLPLNRHIQEVRFNTGGGHSIATLASGMARAATRQPAAEGSEWWAGKPDADGQSCTQRYRTLLRASCARPNDSDYCPG